MNSKKFLVAVAAVSFLLMCCVALPVIIVDPFFHYHGPLSSLDYYFYNQRYVNDGIISNFEYDAMITGTSMTENFKASQLDSLFGTDSIKVPFFGATFKEINQNIEKATKENPNLKMVVRGLDYYNIYADKDLMEYDEDMYPSYLYDENIFNDVYYVLDKEVFTRSVMLDTVINTFSSGNSTNFDEYSAWYQYSVFGKDVTLSTYTRPEEIKPMLVIDDEYKNMVYENIMQNVVELAQNNPDIEFYYFYPPYSIAYFDREYREGRLERNLDCGEYATELILQCPNIKLFSFYDQYDVICNLDNYKDILHYDEKVSESILNWMKEGTGLLTKDNYKQHFENMRQFYLNYDYESIFE